MFRNFFDNLLHCRIIYRNLVADREDPGKNFLAELGLLPINCGASSKRENFC